ncbi:MAG: FitA-like ribbon-helix-helix domain-containing protein, partial [Pararhodobacter sp.]
MASITIRKLDDRVKEALRLRAARNGRSMEEEARELLEAALVPRELQQAGIAAARSRLAAVRPPLGAPLMS